MTEAERVARAFIADAMKRAESGRYPIVEPGPDDNRRDLDWWLPVLDAKAFLFSTSGSAAWLFPHYGLRLAPLSNRLVVELGGETIVDSTECFEFRETAHAPQVYIPRAAVDPRHLIASETLSCCPFKGVARHHGVRAGGREVQDALWSYDEPFDRFPENGNASDIARLRGLFGVYQGRLPVRLEPR